MTTVYLKANCVVLADIAGKLPIVRQGSPPLIWQGNTGASVGPGGTVALGPAVAHGLIVVPATNRLTVFG
ncbi:hypothetical protein [Flindersiella endophytica]